MMAFLLSTCLFILITTFLNIIILGILSVMKILSLFVILDRMKETRTKRQSEAASEVLSWVNKSRKLEKERVLQLSKIFEEQVFYFILLLKYVVRYCFLQFRYVINTV